MRAEVIGARPNAAELRAQRSANRFGHSSGRSPRTADLSPPAVVNPIAFQAGREVPARVVGQTVFGRADREESSSYSDIGTICAGSFGLPIDVEYRSGVDAVGFGLGPRGCRIERQDDHCRPRSPQDQRTLRSQPSSARRIACEENGIVGCVRSVRDDLRKTTKIVTLSFVP